MSDIADAAEVLEEAERATGIAAVRAKACLTFSPRKTCLFCDAPTKAGARWCDRECRDDYLRQLARATKES